MDIQDNRGFRFLDTEDDRRELAADMHRVRQSVIQLVERVPAAQVYEPRYHGWSPAAMLAHLNTIDNLALLGIKLALLGIRLPLPEGALNSFNDFTAQIFQRRVIETTIRSVHANEKRIVAFITTLPVARFTKEVYYPQGGEYLTVERAIQQYFLFHWQDHLEAMQRAEGVYYEPPGTTEV